jgi:DNA ligase-associated metallophosphoesterase
VIDCSVTVRGEPLVLMPERAAFWKAGSTLLVADPHFGKSATFRAEGIPVPAGTTMETLARLDRAVARMAAQRIAFLGDFLHARAGRSAETLGALAEWRRRNSHLAVTLVRGNHDRRAGDPPGELGIECVDAPHFMPPFVLAHYPAPHEEGYVLAGHIHPAVRLYGRGGQSARLSCFALTGSYGVLPAFGEFTGLADVDPPPGSAVYALAGDEVIEVR